VKDTRPPNHELKPIFITTNPMEAEEIRCLLEGSGLTPFVFDSRAPIVNPFVPAPLAGARVMLPADQFEHATEVLRDAGRLTGEPPLMGKNLSLFTDVRADNRAFGLIVLVLVAAGLILIGASFIRGAAIP
jgi:hypothetical protein